MNRKTVFQELRVNQLMKYSFLLYSKNEWFLLFYGVCGKEDEIREKRGHLFAWSCALLAVE